MHTRLLILTAALIAWTAPLAAEEVQLNFGGLAECASAAGCTVQGSVPFAISFDLNTLSGTLTPTFVPLNGVSCLEILAAQGISMTNFNASIGRRNIAAPKSGKAGALADLFGGLGSCETHGYDLGLGTSTGFDIDTALGKSLTQAQYQASEDPLLFLLSQINGHGSAELLPDWNLTITNESIHAVPVPEPDVGALFLLGLLGVGLSRVRRGAPRM